MFDIVFHFVRVVVVYVKDDNAWVKNVFSSVSFANDNLFSQSRYLLFRLFFIYYYIFATEKKLSEMRRSIKIKQRGGRDGRKNVPPNTLGFGRYFFPPLRFLLFFFIFHNINFSFFLWLWNFSLLTTLYTLSTRHNRLSCCDCAGWHLLDEGKRPRSLLFLAKKKERWRRAEIRTTTKKQVFPDFSTLRFAFLSNLLFYWIFLTSLICPDIARVFIIWSNFSLFSFLIDSSSVSLHCQLKLFFHYTTHFTRFFINLLNFSFCEFHC